MFLSLDMSWDIIRWAQSEDVMISIFASISSLPLRALNVCRMHTYYRPQDHTPLATLAFHFLPTLRVFCLSDEQYWRVTIGEDGVTRQPQKMAYKDGCEALESFDWEWRDIFGQHRTSQGSGRPAASSNRTSGHVVEDGLPFFSSEF
ncbi:hypothetical protein BOTBODRAFT_636733 [Botryobasidium botryosum FD-172 SS1]|uniref:Uncharacterized protein n=1 Tax=Botryobasidium botryosum (strain FD-172 SS1) TaxID=930990 RepID=A0A067MVP9_BOTB1|nr:hypothetical protein BOTBODRAFT_636733 [Botryobasidium botryosum FD-172 SS1]